MNIKLTGNLGSGKTTICNILKERGYEIVSTGKIFRQIAEEKNVSVIELNKMIGSREVQKVLPYFCTHIEWIKSIRSIFFV